MSHVLEFEAPLFKININRIIDNVKFPVSTLEVSVKEPLDVWLNGTKNG